MEGAKGETENKKIKTKKLEDEMKVWKPQLTSWVTLIEGQSLACHFL